MSFYNYYVSFVTFSYSLIYTLHLLFLGLYSNYFGVVYLYSSCAVYCIFETSFNPAVF